MNLEKKRTENKSQAHAQSINPRRAPPQWTGASASWRPAALASRVSSSAPSSRRWSEWSTAPPGSCAPRAPPCASARIDLSISIEEAEDWKRQNVHEASTMLIFREKIFGRSESGMLFPKSEKKAYHERQFIFSHCIRERLRTVQLDLEDSAWMRASAPSLPILLSKQEECKSVKSRCFNQAILCRCNLETDRFDIRALARELMPFEEIWFTDNEHGRKWGSRDTGDVRERFTVSNTSLLPIAEASLAVP